MDLPLLLTAQERKDFDTALGFAKEAHGAQVRNYTGEPYWNHVYRVAVMVSKAANRTSDMMQAALLHDTVEDTSVSERLVRIHFGPKVAELVMALTDPPHAYGNRRARKAFVCAKMAAADWMVHTIKLADLIDNTESIVRHDPNFAVLYLKEKAALLTVLTKGDAALLARAHETMTKANHAVGAWAGA